MSNFWLSYMKNSLITMSSHSMLRTTSKKPGTMALNTLLEMLRFGPSVILSKSERAAFFFRTAFMFRTLSTAIAEIFSKEADDFDFVLQTQAFFNAALPRRPLVLLCHFSFTAPRCCRR